MSSDWSQQLANELHKPITRNFQKRLVISNGIDDIWAADLVEMQKFSKWNKGIKYLLMVIDVFSKYGWIRGLKDKKTETVSKAFDDIFKSKRKPQMLWTDKGSEFISKHFKDFLKRKGIKLYHTENEEKSSVVERWNKGIKYLLMVIDVFSKYGWIRGLKDKKTETVSKAFNDIFKRKRKPQMLWTDKGSEFISKHFKDFLKREGINLYHTENEEKSSVVERWNKAIKNRMWKMFTVNNNTVYWDKLDKLVNDYNNSRHSSIKMTPVEASKKKNKKNSLV